MVKEIPLHQRIWEQEEQENKTARFLDELRITAARLVVRHGRKGGHLLTALTRELSSEVSFEDSETGKKRQVPVKIHARCQSDGFSLPSTRFKPEEAEVIIKFGDPDIDDHRHPSALLQPGGKGHTGWRHGLGPVVLGFSLGWKDRDVSLREAVDLQKVCQSLRLRLEAEESRNSK